MGMVRVRLKRARESAQVTRISQGATSLIESRTMTTFLLALFFWGPLALITALVVWA